MADDRLSEWSPSDRPTSGGTSTRRRSWRAWGLHGLVAASAVGAVALDRRIRRSRSGGGRVPLAPLVAAGAYYLVLWASEARHPHDDSWRPARPEVMTDLAFLGSSLVASTAGQAVAAALGSHPPPRSEGKARVGRLPTAVGVAVAIVGYDLVHSRMHHLGHVWGPGWRIHSVHHSPKRLYWFNATRFHVVEMAVEGFLEGMVIGLSGLTRDQHVAYQAVRVTYGQLQHCNVDLRSGALDHVFSTPDLHRWHHSTVYEEGDTNYGAITSFWDKLFGTFFRPDDRDDRDGPDGPDELGVGRMPDFPTRFVELQRVPSDWPAIRERNAATWNSAEPDAGGVQLRAT